MARILVTWELGGGLGHLVPLASIIGALTKRGHQLFAAVRELAHLEAVFGDLEVLYLQSPVKTTRAANCVNTPRTFAHILHNAGFGEPSELTVMTRAWRNLYEFIQPDLILFDYSPTAVLASRAIETKRVVIGTGFCCPPDACPLPDFRPWLPAQSELLRRDEDRVLANVNRLLESWRLEPLDRLARLHVQVDATILATFPKLDAYPNRGEAEYFGVWSNAGGKEPVWPAATGKKVFAYLKHFPGLPQLLEALNRSRRPALVYLDPPDADLRTRFESPTLRFEPEPLDLNAIGKTCDLAILNGGHGATASLLLAGKPLLEIPLNLEQSLNSAAVTRLGAGLTGDLNQPTQNITQFLALLQSDEYARAARRFAAEHVGFDPERQVERIVHRIESLL
jgi:UDP:flavonoid glycosyltransferase YjiC (YdhE family)